MTAPFFKFGYFSEDIGLVLAIVIGIGFGFHWKPLYTYC